MSWLKYTKSNFGWGAAPNPAGEAYNSPPDPLVGWGRGHSSPDSPHSTPTARRSHVKQESDDRQCWRNNIKSGPYGFAVGYSTGK